jgi:YCII-related domain
LVSGKLAKPGDFNVTVNFLGSQLRIVGLGGYYVILADSRDAAVRVAARHPGARLGTVEVRPLFDLSGLRRSTPIS